MALAVQIRSSQFGIYSETHASRWKSTVGSYERETEGHYSKQKRGIMATRYLHMTLFWGRKTEILFRGWPGARVGMYALALVVIFLMTFLVEMLSWHRLTDLGPLRRRRVQARLLQTAVHTVQVGVAYLLMLALMSFNIGVLLVAIAGSIAGFFVFHSSVLLPATVSEVGVGLAATEASPPVK